MRLENASWWTFMTAQGTAQHCKHLIITDPELWNSLNMKHMWYQDTPHEVSGYISRETKDKMALASGGWGGGSAGQYFSLTRHLLGMLGVIRQRKSMSMDPTSRWWTGNRGVARQGVSVSIALHKLSTSSVDWVTLGSQAQKLRLDRCHLFHTCPIPDIPHPAGATLL